MLDPTPVFDDVKTKIESIVAPLGIEVYEAELPEYVLSPSKGSLWEPFVTIYTGGPIRSGSDRHLVGTRRDTTVLFWTVQAYAPKMDVANRIKGDIINGLTGYRPVDGGEMILAGGNTPSRGNNEVRPTQYIAETQFTCRSNLSWVD